MGGREFVMKDLYSFNRTEAEQDQFYEKVTDAYRSVFDRCGIGGLTYLNRATGGTFSQYSHEFQTLSDAGEDVIYITDEKKKEAINKELGEKDGQELKSIEIANIFKQGTKFTDPFNLYYQDEKGEKR